MSKLKKYGAKKYGTEGYYLPRLAIGSTTFFKLKSNARKFAKDVKGKLRKTKHTIRGKGYLVYK